MDDNEYWRFIMLIARRLSLMFIMCSTSVSASMFTDLREYSSVDFTNNQQEIKGLSVGKLQIKTDIGAIILRKAVNITLHENTEKNISRELMIKEDIKRLKELRTIDSPINSSIVLTNTPPVTWFMGVTLLGLVSFGRRKPVMPK